MGCSKCKKKKKETEKLKTKGNSIIETDRVIMWILIIWLLFGVYGLWSLIGKIFHI